VARCRPLLGGGAESGRAGAGGGEAPGAGGGRRAALGVEQKGLRVCPVSFVAAKRIFFFLNFTYGCLVIRLRFSETLILTLCWERKTRFSGFSLCVTVLFTKFVRFGSSSTVCQLLGKD